MTPFIQRPGTPPSAAISAPPAGSSIAQNAAQVAPSDTPNFDKNREKSPVFADFSHISGLYFPKDPAKISIIFDNSAKTPLQISGELLFGTRDLPQTAAAPFKTLSITPLSPTAITPGQRAKFPLDLTFAGTGSYELLWNLNQQNSPILSDAGIPLQCIFPPRTTPAAANSSDESPWIAPLPNHAPTLPGYLTDFSHQTSVRRFLIDERFAFDPKASVGLGFGASLRVGAKEVDALIAEAKRAKISFVLRVTVPSTVTADAITLAGFKQYITDALRRGKGVTRALIISPDTQPMSAEAFKAFYLTGYEASKREDKSILMLGLGTAQATAQAIQNQNLAPYIDAIAVTDAVTQPLIAQALTLRRPLWILPSATPPPPAAALASGAAVVPLPSPSADRGAGAHLLGGTVFYNRVHLAVRSAARAADIGNSGSGTDLPFIAVFQGDGYAVAAIAGIGAGTPIDAVFPEGVRTVVEPVKAGDGPTYANLEISDDTHTMRVVDAAGAAVDCRVGDTVYVPVGDKVMYVLQAGAAEDLAGTIRPALANRLPLFGISPQMVEGNKLTARLLNVRAEELAGTLRVIVPGERSEILAEKAFSAIYPNKTLEIPLELSGSLPAGRPVIFEIVAGGWVQRTAMVVDQK